MDKGGLQKEPLRFLVEGDPSSGKTTFVDTANDCSETKPLLHIDARGNTIAVTSITDWEHQTIRVKNVTDINTVYNWLLHGQKQEGKIAEWFPKVKFKSVAIDTLTEVQQFLYAKIMGFEHAQIGQAWPKAEYKHWGQVLLQTTTLVRLFYDLSLHVFFTVQSDESQDGDTGAVRHRPQLWGRSVKAVPAYAYVHMFLVQVERLSMLKRGQLGIPTNADINSRVALFTPRFDSMAKDQYTKLGAQMLNPTVSKICKKIYGGK